MNGRPYLVVVDDPEHSQRYEVTLVADSDRDAEVEATGHAMGIEWFLAGYGTKRDQYGLLGFIAEYDTYDEIECALEDWACFAVAYQCSYGFERVLVPSDEQDAMLLDARLWSAGNWPELVT